MRALLLVSSLLLTPAIAISAPSCAVPQPAPDAASQPSDLPAQAITAASTTGGLTPIGADRIERVPALRRIASNGAQLLDLGVQHGLQTVFATNGSTFQVFYLAPDGQAAVGGVMWDSAGHNITRSQVATIEGTISTVTIGSPAAPTPVPPAPDQAAGEPSKSALKAAEATVFGTTGPATAPRLYVFIDPLCSFSVRAMDQLRPYIASGKLQVAVIPLSVLDYEDQGRSTIAAEGLLSLPADQIVAAWRDHPPIFSAGSLAAFARRARSLTPEARSRPMIGRRLLSRAAIGLASLLSACATPKIDPNVDAYGMPSAELALQRSIGQVDSAMLSLGGMNVASRLPAAPVMPAELQRPESLAWSGPIDDGAKALADRIGYRLVVTAPAETVPVSVAVNLANVPIIDLFKALGAAAGTQATVIVDPDRHQVQVQHHV